MSRIYLVCGECGGFLKDIYVPHDVESEQTLQVEQCSVCRTRAVDIAYLQGQDDAKEGMDAVPR